MARRKLNEKLPTFDELFVPILKALKKLGGSGTINEINDVVYQIESFPEELVVIPHDGFRNEIDYRLAWARTYLKKSNLLDNSIRGVWTLTDSDVDINKIKPDEIVKKVRNQKKDFESEKNSSKEENTDEQISESSNWKEKLLEVLLKIRPDAFERLAQRLLRESGFIQVEVTGQSGDGGIDGKGIVKISGFLSFHVIFQCKRYKSQITPSQIRDFRGAMQGRADKGLFITTSSFTRDAYKEATRDGAPPIDLIDGELLCEKLKEYKLGVETELIEKCVIKSDWFDKL